VNSHKALFSGRKPSQKLGGITLRKPTTGLNDGSRRVLIRGGKWAKLLLGGTNGGEKTPRKNLPVGWKKGGDKNEKTQAKGEYEGDE